MPPSALAEGTPAAPTPANASAARRAIGAPTPASGLRDGRIIFDRELDAPIAKVRRMSLPERHPDRPNRHTCSQRDDELAHQISPVEIKQVNPTL